MIAAGTPPDVVFIESGWFLNYAKRDTLLSLDEFIKKDKFDLSKYNKTSLESYIYNNKLYGLPNDMAIYALFYNKDLFDKAGIKYPVGKVLTWNELLDIAKKLTRDTNGDGVIDQYGIYPGPWWLWLWQNNADFFKNPKNPKVPVLSSQDAIQAVQFYADLSLKYKVAPTTVVLESGGDSVNMFFTGKLAMIIEGHWMVPKFKYANFKWDVANLPRGKKRANYSAGSCFSIVKGSKHPEAAYKLIKFLAGEKGQKILVKQGFSTPVLKPIMKSEEFLNSGINEKVFLDEMKYGHPMPSSEKWGEIRQKIESELQLVWMGKKTAKEILPQLNKEIIKIMRENK